MPPSTHLYDDWMDHRCTTIKQTDRQTKRQKNDAMESEGNGRTSDDDDDEDEEESIRATAKQEALDRASAGKIWEELDDHFMFPSTTLLSTKLAPSHLPTTDEALYIPPLPEVLLVSTIVLALIIHSI
jgi:hypothetical protein